MLNICDIIEKKKLGNKLTDDEIAFAINGYVNNSIKDYQMSSLLMAICINGMSTEETVSLTKHMLNSGETIDLSKYGNISVDKHSTGGVGDKTSLIVLPTVASAGCVVAKMSGRGLGHTGGTLDKLESIPNLTTNLTAEQFENQVDIINIAVVGQTKNLVPADKKLYALRDVTATVNSIPLIASSIMSKKLASGAKNIVLDIKVGNGAFMETVEDAEKLATLMVNIGKMFNKNIVAVLTNMEQPLGYKIGNAVEVQEAIDILSGKIKTGNLYDVCIELASNLISMAKNIDIIEARKVAIENISSGKSFEKFKEWISAQGGDLNQFYNLPKANFFENIYSEKDGYISEINAKKIGIASLETGAGRHTKEDNIDYLSGIVLNKKCGDYVKSGEIIATIYTNKENVLENVKNVVNDAFSICDNKPPHKPIIIKIIR